ncbi:hypothetical protein LEMLEM_LOCUS16546 [Lemmus lemmus]
MPFSSCLRDRLAPSSSTLIPPKKREDKWAPKQCPSVIWFNCQTFTTGQNCLSTKLKITSQRKESQELTA